MPLYNPTDITAHTILATGVHGVGVSTVCSETEAAAIAAAAVGAFHNATLADFQATPATGTVTTAPENINDNNTGTTIASNVIGHYAEVDFGRLVSINQWRLYGHANNNKDGVWKIEYLGTDLAWHDWVTGIPTNQAVWTSMAAEAEVICSKVRLTITTVDSIAFSYAKELEVYHS